MDEHQPLTDEEIKEFQKTYSMFDYDENGTISTNQLGTVMRALGLNPSDGEVQDIINEIDAEGNGVIEFPEFLTVMSRKINEIDNEDEIRDAINIIFKDREYVSAVEIWYLMRKFGDKLSDEEVQDFINQTRTDGDGKIRYEGAYFYWDYIEDTVIRGKGPTAVTSKLGYLLSGPTSPDVNRISGAVGMFNILTNQNPEEFKVESIGEVDTEHENENMYKKHQ
ncbi:calmodulin-alpha-like [Mytilus edulis]|uniref:calmodulin-alpha-like n=1 Tax=Mytilus edulis TaxID=6550 RepID=UPI0039EE5A17